MSDFSNRRAELDARLQELEKRLQQIDKDWIPMTLKIGKKWQRSVKKMKF